jgi:hypothetical protein
LDTLPPVLLFATPFEHRLDTVWTPFGHVSTNCAADLNVGLSRQLDAGRRSHLRCDEHHVSTSPLVREGMVLMCSWTTFVCLQRRTRPQPGVPPLYKIIAIMFVHTINCTNDSPESRCGCRSSTGCHALYVCIALLLGFLPGLFCHSAKAAALPPAAPLQQHVLRQLHTEIPQPPGARKLLTEPHAKGASPCAALWHTLRYCLAHIAILPHLPVWTSPLHACDSGLDSACGIWSIELCQARGPCTLSACTCTRMLHLCTCIVSNSWHGLAQASVLGMFACIL